MKKVLIFSLQYYPLVGGAEVAIREITDRIAPSDIEFHMLTLRFRIEDAREERIGNVVVHRLGRGSRGLTYAASFSPAFYLSKVFFVPRAALVARGLHRREHFDAFWAMMSYMLFPIVLLRLMGARVPYLLTLQEGDPFEHVFDRTRIRLVGPLLRAGFRRATSVQAISSFLGAWAKRAGYPGEPAIIGNGVDLARFAAPLPPSEREAARKELGVASCDTLLITTSRLVEKNAVDDVIRALANLPQDVRFVICGDGPDRAELEALAHSEGVALRVRFMGTLAHEALPRLLHAADIFIRPSRSEGMGNSFIEAMTAGLPIIATQEGGIADFLFDARRNPGKASTGFAVDRDSPEQIAEKVQHILVHPDEVRETVANAKKLVSEKYDWDLIAKKTRALFGRVFMAGRIDS